jgi:hypothetical protein
MNWLWVLILIPIIVVGVIFAYFVMPRTPAYVPKTTTTLKSVAKITTTTVRTNQITTTTALSSPCTAYKGVCKTNCNPDEDQSPFSCDANVFVCCMSRKITTTPTSVAIPTGFIPT